MSESNTQHVWVLLINGVQIGLWRENDMARLRLPVNVSPQVRAFIGSAVHTWLHSAVRDMDERKGT